MLSCKETARLISEGLDRDLSWRERISLRLHVIMCSVCRAYKRQIEGLNKLVSGCFGSPAGSFEPESLSDEVRQRIKKALRKDGS